MFFKLYKMYQQPIQGQNQKIVYQYNNAQIPQNQNQLLANNQLQYQMQLAPQQAIQRNQAQIQNIQQPQQPQNMQHLQNTQILNAQKYQQAQNMQKIHKHQQAQKIQNTQIPHNVNPQQIPLGQNTQKTYPANQIQKTIINTQVMQNPMTQQNVLLKTNINQGQALKTNLKKQIASSHLDLSQTPSLEPVPQIPNQPHLQIQQKHHHQTNHNPNQIPHQNQQMENLKNTAFLSPQNPKNNPNPTLVKPQPNKNQQKNDNATKKSATLMTVNSLANIPYDEYPDVEFSKKQAHNIIAFGANSYNGKIKKYNEDTYKHLIGVEKDCIINGTQHKKIISYFGLFDGHGGDKCSIFLRNKFHEILFNLKNFPANPSESIRDAFNYAENQFYHMAVINGKLVDKSGSCATIALIIDNILYSINLGDSRALYSRDGGKEFYQITRDHKPNDDIERKRIEKYGGKVYYANKTVVNGVEVTLKEEDFGKGFTFPYRLLPSGLAVSFYL